jgi:hypothetical protein
MAKSTVDWDEVQKAYEERRFKTNALLCAHFGITKSQLYHRMKRGNWRRKVLRRAARRPLARLKALAERKIEALEDEGDAIADSSVTNLTALLKLIERIITLEHKEKAVERRSKPALDDGRRRELARRIEAIQRQLELERSREAALAQGDGGASGAMASLGEAGPGA